MELQKAYKTMQAASGIEVGDTVRVLRKAERREMGWQNSWWESMNGSVGKSGIVAGVYCHGIRIEGINCPLLYPFFCLELISKGEAPIKIGEHIAKIDESGIKVGCTKVDWNTFDKIAERRPK